MISKTIFLNSFLIGLLLMNPNAYAADGLKASMVAVDVTPPIGVPLAGFGGGGRRLKSIDVFNRYKYATYLKPSNSKHDPIRSKVLVLEKDGKRLAFVSLDIVAIERDLRSDFINQLKDLGFAEDNLFISATHTHSGPGTISKNFAWGLLAADKYQKNIRRKLISDVDAAIRLAVSTLEPAELLAGTFQAEDLQTNRRDLPGHFDSKANLLWVRAQGGSKRWIGVMANLAIHGTALGASNLAYSADVMGGIERALESRMGEGSVALFINGAEGDVTPMHRGLDGIELTGELFANQAWASLPGARSIAPQWKVVSVDITLPKPGLNVKGCVDQPLFKKMMFWNSRLSLGFWFHRDTRIWAIELGDMVMLSWPGEPTTTLGLQLKEWAQSYGYSQAWVMGLTNDHLAYFTTHDEYLAGGYESCGTLYRYQGGERIVDAHEGLLAKLRD